MKGFQAALAIVFTLCLAGRSNGQDLKVSKDGVGPFVVGTLQVDVNDAAASLSAKIRNDSALPIQLARFCIQAVGRTKGCDYQIWNDHPWKPGEEIRWNLKFPAVHGIETPTISLVEIKKDKVLPPPPAPPTPPDRFRVYLSAPMREGFIDTNKDLQDSIADIRTRLASSKQLRIVDKRDDADIILTVVKRGVGSESYGQRLSYTAYFGNAVLTSVPVMANTYWIATVMQVGNYKKEFSAAYTNRAAASLGAWGADAAQIADDLTAWVSANASQLKNGPSIAHASEGSEPQPNGAAPILGTGSGFFITNNGYLLTAAHVVAGGQHIGIWDPTTNAELPAAIVKVDAVNDVAVLKVDGNFESIPLGNTSQVKLGASVFTIGFPKVEVQGFSPKLTRGEINSLAGIQDDPRQFQISAQIQPGNSGGALVDARGSVVGLVVAKLGDAYIAGHYGYLPEDVNYAIKVSYARALVDDLPEIVANLRKVDTTSRTPEEVVQQVQSASVLLIIRK